MLTDTQKRALVDLARRAVLRQVAGKRPATAPANPGFPHASGVFVTLTRAGELRGCLGTLRCSHGLAAEVMRCAADAASTDPRFPPVARVELADLFLEVSVLGPLEPCDPCPDAIVIGRDGLVIELGTARGLLLPQVASEHHWTPEQFLEHACTKAGLAENAWQLGATVLRFEAQVFGEPVNP